MIINKFYIVEYPWLMFLLKTIIEFFLFFIIIIIIIIIIFFLMCSTGNNKHAFNFLVFNIDLQPLCSKHHCRIYIFKYAHLADKRKIKYRYLQSFLQWQSTIFPLKNTNIWIVSPQWIRRATETICCILRTRTSSVCNNEWEKGQAGQRCVTATGKVWRIMYFVFCSGYNALIFFFNICCPLWSTVRLSVE